MVWTIFALGFIVVALVLAWSHGRRRSRGLTREICKCCHRESPLGFSVPNDVWTASVPHWYRNSVLCITCFDMFATDQGVDWTATPIQWWPVSGAQFREMMNAEDARG